ncbi:hypothetical protein [Paraburkholderia sp. BCC1884]|uniref:hypothetical protein n=1 Tax=Paraburkholderia sp. BCC1884 TaxID=2562668 RepID=UPI001184457E|nr:hypothetical protein [Paraburkholderia sp. BCC1884]
MHWIDPACLLETRGKVVLFLLNSHGEADGFILEHADGTQQQVHFPPHLGKSVTRNVTAGDTVRVRGVKPRDVTMIAAVALTTKQGVEIADEGPHHHGHDAKHEHGHHGGAPMEVQGEVVMALYGPKGELRGALLEDGTSLRMPPHAAAELIAYLSPGAHVQAWGHGVKNKLGCTVDVHDIAELVDAEEGLEI